MAEFLPLSGREYSISLDQYIGILELEMVRVRVFLHDFSKQ